VQPDYLLRGCRGGKSGGFQKRMGLILAILVNPEILKILAGYPDQKNPATFRRRVQN
jgi:hypothetical protein